MKVCKPIKHLPKNLRRLYKEFRRHNEPQIKSFLIDEMRFLGFSDFANELQVSDEQNQLKSQQPSAMRRRGF